MTVGLRSELANALEDRYPGVRLESLVADASARRFHRLFLTDGGTRVVMDYGAPFEGETDDVRLARIFERAALPVARVHEVLPEAGALIMEDLGDLTLETAIDQARSGRHPSRDTLYRKAVLMAADISTRGSETLRRSERAQGPALDEERFMFEMNFFLEHYVGSFLGRPDPGKRVREAVEDLARTTASHPRVLCHRDYHSRNIMVLPEGALAMVDIQDARWGPDSYDLASLLRDAYVDVEEREVDECFDLYRRQIEASSDTTELRERFDVVAAQRMLKALGTFGYQVAVLRRARYQNAIPRTVKRLARLLPGCTPTNALGELLLRNGLISESFE